MSNPHDYMIGWICSINAEFVAASSFLDEVHEIPASQAQTDYNVYTLGRVGNHNVVIATSLHEKHGATSAASVAGGMLRAFPNIRIVLLVGVGGGIPSSQHDIRLGDIVVSNPSNDKAGMIDYEYDSAIQGQILTETGRLDPPQAILRMAMATLDGLYTAYGSHLKNNIAKTLEKQPHLQNEYSRPSEDRDGLFTPEYNHRGSTCSCSQLCDDEQTSLVLRQPRAKPKDDLAVHYGLIASADQPMRDSRVRDKLAAEESVLCFETGAAGLLQHFPCLVIRGISSYSDSHNNQEWQGYAAMAAAAYAKDLLLHISPQKVEVERKINDVLSSNLSHQTCARDKCLCDVGSRQVAKEQRDGGKEQIEVPISLTRSKLPKEYQDCHRIFQLTAGSDTSYEWHKDRVGKGQKAHVCGSLSMTCFGNG